MLCIYNNAHASDGGRDITLCNLEWGINSPLNLLATMFLEKMNSKMGTLFNNQFRIESTRMRNWNYAWNGAYFITICVGGGAHSFGHIKDDTMFLSDVGEIAKQCWLEIPLHFPFVELDEYVIMPNHMHGILIIRKPSVDLKKVPMKERKDKEDREKKVIATTLFTVVGSYKSAVSKRSRHLGTINLWQPRFYDHIIRNDDDYDRIRTYIRSNPSRWQNDQLNVK